MKHLKPLAAIVIVIAAVFLPISHNYFLAQQNVTGPEGNNLVVNPSAKHSNPYDPKNPYGWQAGYWGKNKVSFTYITDKGFNDNRSLKVSITQYDSGDAKWVFDDVKVVGGKTYKFGDHYIADTNSSVVANCDAGNIPLNNSLPPASNWTKFETTFKLPDNATHLAVYHLLRSRGNLTTDSSYLVPVGFTDTRTFKEPIVSLVFTGAISDDYLAAQTVNRNCYAATFYVPGNITADVSKFYGPARTVDRIYWVGNEIGFDCNGIGDEKDLVQYADLANIRWHPVTSAESGQPLTNATKDHFASRLGQNSGDNDLATFDRYDLKTISADSLTAKELDDRVNAAADKNDWLILQYSTTPPKEHLALLKNSSLRVLTISQALKELTPQLPD